MKRYWIYPILALVVFLGGYMYLSSQQDNAVSNQPANATATPSTEPNPLAIETMRQKQYPGSNITIEQTLADGSNYHQYIASYKSDGLKIYALLTVPAGQKPKNGWPVILFNHGYIPPTQYTTTGNYVQYVAALASYGYIVFKPDYRGNGNSEGTPVQSYVSPDYVTDDLNALASIKQYKDADPTKIGVWAHSMGGFITISDLVVKPDAFKAAVIWGGVVGDATELLSWWQQRVQSGVLTTQNDQQTAQLVAAFEKVHGTPQSNSGYWNAMDPNAFITDIKAPVQVNVGTADETVPPTFSKNFYNRLKQQGKTAEYYEYAGDNHNISNNFTQAMQNSLAFFDKYLK